MTLVSKRHHPESCAPSHRDTRDNPAPCSHAVHMVAFPRPRSGRTRVPASRLLLAALTLGTMLSLKLHYRQATADQLAWILAPTARLVAWLTPAHPVFEHGVGHVDFSQGIIIAPACAGINFLIMAFGLTACSGLLRMTRAKTLMGWLVFCLTGAYAGTLLINTLRIALSIQLYQADFYSGWLTPERLHRVAGAAIYMGALILAHGMAEPLASRWMHRASAECAKPAARSPRWLPLAWYLTGTVGVPLVNMAFRQRAPFFWEHCITLVLTSVVIWSAVRLAGQRQTPV